MWDSMKNKNRNEGKETLLMGLLKKITQEYRSLLEAYNKIITGIKPYKITEIVSFSDAPGETVFSIQVTNKNCEFKLSAGEIVRNNYNLDSFGKFHAEMIKHAAKGSLRAYLKMSEIPKFSIDSKYIDRKSKKHVFYLKNSNESIFIKTAEEISMEENLLSNLPIKDIYDVAFTQGVESITNEEKEILRSR